MRQIIDFFVRNKNFILFLSLFSFSLILIFSNSRYHNSFVLNSTNSLTGRIFETTNFISSYLNLKKLNILKKRGVCLNVESFVSGIGTFYFQRNNFNDKKKCKLGVCIFFRNNLFLFFVSKFRHYSRTYPHIREASIME